MASLDGKCHMMLMFIVGDLSLVLGGEGGLGSCEIVADHGVGIRVGDRMGEVGVVVEVWVRGGNGRWSGC